jgi:hypothetical protein
VLHGDQMRRFVADQRHLPSLVIKRPDGSASVVTTTTRSVVFHSIRKMLRDAMDSGTADRIGLRR